MSLGMYLHVCWPQFKMAAAFGWKNYDALCKLIFFELTICLAMYQVLHKNKERNNEVINNNYNKERKQRSMTPTKVTIHLPWVIPTSPIRRGSADCHHREHHSMSPALMTFQRLMGWWEEARWLTGGVLFLWWTFHSMSRWRWSWCQCREKKNLLLIRIKLPHWCDETVFEPHPGPCARPRVCVVTSSYAAQLLPLAVVSVALPVWTFYNSKVKSSKSATRRRLLLLQKLLPIQKRILR